MTGIYWLAAVSYALGVPISVPAPPPDVAVNIVGSGGVGEAHEEAVGNTMGNRENEELAVVPRHVVNT